MTGVKFRFMLDGVDTSGQLICPLNWTFRKIPRSPKPTQDGFTRLRSWVRVPQRPLCSPWSTRCKSLTPSSWSYDVRERNHFFSLFLAHATRRRSRA